jgi:hypothetical protein
MAIYALRKRRGHWTVFSGNDVLLAFDNYQEAVETTRAALNVLELAAQANTQGEVQDHLREATSSFR